METENECVSANCADLAPRPFARGQGISPNVEDGVAAPGTPGLGEFFGPFGGDAAKIVAHGDVFLGKGIGPAQGAHRDVMGGPLADAGEFGKALDGVIGVVMGAVVEGEFTGDMSAREGNDAFAAGAGHAEFGDV